MTKQVALASRADADAVIASAAAAFPTWRDMSLARRTQVLFRFRELLNERKHEAAEIITSEHGKVLSDALGEITRGQEIVELACGLAHLLKGSMTENASTKVDVSSHPAAAGRGRASSRRSTSRPWCRCGSSRSPSPPATPSSSSPRRRTPRTANWLAGIWKEAGLPDGVFNVLHGDKVAVDALLEDPRVKAISFVGSTPIAQYVYSTGTANGKRVQALGGAKNHMLVLPDADLDLAADAAVNGGFGSAGERCMAISALLAVDSVADELSARSPSGWPPCAPVTAAGAATWDLWSPGNTGTRSPATCRPGSTPAPNWSSTGGPATPTSISTATKDGFWLGPTLFDNVTPDMSIYTDEIFGPVLSVVRVDGYGEGLDLINSNPYGNGTALFTNDGGAARRFQNEVQVGMIGINVPVPVPVGYYSFGGWKASLFGDTHAHGTEGFHFYTRGKVITTRWLDPSHGGLNLGFPQND